MITQEQRNNIINWIAALRSGAYQQTTKILQRADGSCCGLGVACNVLKVPKEETLSCYQFIFDNVPYYSAIPICFFKESFGDFLDASLIIQMNDRGKTFDEIANYIEKQLEEYETL